MPEYTQEEIDKIVEEKIIAARQHQFFVDNGIYGFTVALEYIEDQVNRKSIPKSVLDVMGQVYTVFRVDMGIDPAPQQNPTAEQKKET